MSRPPGAAGPTDRPVHYEIRATPRGPLRLFRGPLARQLKNLIDGDLARLKTLAESR